MATFSSLESLAGNSSNISFSRSSSLLDKSLHLSWTIFESLSYSAFSAGSVMGKSALNFFRTESINETFFGWEVRSVSF